VTIEPGRSFPHQHAAGAVTGVEPPPTESDVPLPPTKPLLLWLTLQLAVLALAAARVPLAAKYPRPAESLAIHLMLATQVAAAALLFPFILRDLRVATMVIVSTWPFDLLAAHLSALPAAQFLPAVSYVTLWLVTLTIWRSVVTSDMLQLVAVTVATAWALGGAGLSYLHDEFTARGVGEGVVEFAADGLSPMVGAIRLLQGDMDRNKSAAPWIAAGVILALGVAAKLFLVRRDRSRRSAIRIPPHVQKPAN
jgi:hypothetical protein